MQAITKSVNANKVQLNHFTPLVSFYTPRKHHQTRGFPIFSGGIEKDQ